MKLASTKTSHSPKPAIPPLNILVAFPFFKPKITELLLQQRPESYRLLVDSGAFSAHNSGVPIELDDYCAFLDELAESGLSFKAVQLDVIGDPKATWKNFVTMKKRGYDVLPVFTRGASERDLERMYGEADYVLVGGMVGHNDNHRFLKWLMPRVAKRKTHWLGFTKPDLIKAYRPTSVDSTSWNGAVVRGGTQVYLRGGRMPTFTREKFLPKLSDSLFRRQLERCGLDEQDVRSLWSRSNWMSVTSMAGRLCVNSAIIRASEIEKNVHTRVYLACNAWKDVELLFERRNDLWQRGLL